MSSDTAAAPISKSEVAVMASAGMVFGAGWALFSGQDFNWDARSCYFYTAWAFLNGRTTYDIAPGQMANWLNPVLYVPQYLLVSYFPPVVAGAVLGAVAGLNFTLVYFLARIVLPCTQFSLAAAVALLVAVGGLGTPQFLDSLGRYSGDPFVTLLVLGALLAVASAHSSGASPRAQGGRAYLLGGALLGAACGFKLTAALFAVGLTVALLLLWRVLRLDWGRFARYAAGGVAGFLLTGGYWAAFLLWHYGSPVFPYWNRLFRSPWAERMNLQDERFLPASLAEALAYPFEWFAGGASTHETFFRDPRFAILTILLPVVLLYLGLLRATPGSGTLASAPSSEQGPFATRQHFWLLLLFFVLSYALWLKQFSIQRYMMPLGLLAGLLLFLLLDRLLTGSNLKAAVFTALILMTLPFTSYQQMWRGPYGQDWYGMQLSQSVAQPNTLFLLLGDVPSGYVIPFLPSSSRAIRLSGNTFGVNGDLLLDETSRMGQAARSILRDHPGPVRTLAMAPLDPWDQLQLRRFGLQIDDAGCETFTSRADEFTSCSLLPWSRQAFLAVDVHMQRTAWMAPPGTAIRIYVEGNDGPPQLHEERAEGLAWLPWLQLNNRYVFTMVEWDGVADGRLLARAAIDEQGQTTVEVSGPPSD